MAEIVDINQDEFGDRLSRIERTVADNNKMLHGMRRAQRWRSVVSIVWWLVVLGASYYTYHYYLEPYMQQLIGLYNQAQGTQGQLGDFLKNLHI